MTSRASICLSCIVACAIVAAATDARAQARGGRTGGPALAQTAPLPSDPLTGPVVTNAPYSGDAVTTVTQTLGDGTRIEQRAQAKFYRDSAGRIRREQDVLGLAPLTRSTQTQTVVTIDPTPGDAFAYTLDPVARTARRVQRAAGAYFAAIGGLPTPENQWLTARRISFSVDTAADRQGLLRVLTAIQPGVNASQTEESLGTRQMEGVKVTGRRTTSVIPVGEIGNDRPIEITDERWESPELRLLVYSRFSDPRTGVVEYKLTNVIRAEPQEGLFTIPSDYTVLEPGSAGAGGRTGAPGGRGQ